ncbi:hypothetical protein [Paenibacillus chungangensis]|uniref:Uncharacterized protein n=1 Tax=Paenibacillus chungangensis TaxID=696535 RepID=A0ABW3HMT6_9BACL
MKVRNSLRQLRHVYVMLCLAAMVVLLAGCLYPKENTQQNRGAANEAVRNVQAAVDQYLEVTGLLPIHNSTPDVPKFEKFKVDFTKLQAKELIGEIPSVAFEKGGNFYFIVIDEEINPTVKLMDIVSMQKVNDIQNWVSLHIQETGELPNQATAVYPGFYEIDYKVLGKSAPILTSIFSGQTLRAVVDESGIVYLDYGIDIMQQLQKNGDTALEEEGDLRDLLVASSSFVPVKAPSYRYRDGEPVAVRQ